MDSRSAQEKDSRTIGEGQVHGALQATIVAVRRLHGHQAAPLLAKRHDGLVLTQAANLAAAAAIRPCAWRSLTLPSPAPDEVADGPAQARREQDRTGAADAFGALDPVLVRDVATA